MDLAKIDKVVGLLEDDHFRQGGHLDLDQVLQLAERYEATPLELVAIRSELITRELLDPGEEDQSTHSESIYKDSPAPTIPSKPQLTHSSELEIYMREISRVKLLTHEDELRLARRVRAGAKASEAIKHSKPRQRRELEALVKQGVRAKQAMVEANVRLVVSIAKRYNDHGHSHTLLDLVQEGTLGLMRAVDGFEPDLGFRFSTYAAWWIRQSITRAITDSGRTIRIPVHATDLLRKVRKTIRSLRYENGGNKPSIKEVAEHLERDPVLIQCLLEVSTTPLSIDAPGNDHENSTVGDTLGSNTQGPEEIALDRELVVSILSAIEMLPAREREIIELRYGLEDGNSHTLMAIGDRFGLSRERIRQVEAKAIKKLRRLSPDNPLHELLTD